MSTNEKYLCGECGKFITLNKNGTFRYHLTGVKEYPGHPFSPMCKGTHQKP